MNVKKAKALRKVAKYHPTDERKYDTAKTYSFMGRVTEHKRTRVNHEKSKRAIYLELKRAANADA